MWAVGNAVDPRAQLITAAGAGSAAAIALNADLVVEDVELAMLNLGRSASATAAEWEPHHSGKTAEDRPRSLAGG